MKQAPVIAIDGPAASGKSTAARRLARRLGLRYLDSGAMYRAVTWKALRDGADLTDEAALAAVADGMHVDLEPCTDGSGTIVRVDGVNVTEAIRDAELTAKVRFVARARPVRERVGRWQRQMGEAGGIVAEGRDMTTVIFRDADVKFYLDASVDERARRRCQDLARMGQPADVDAVRRELIERDRSDLERQMSPLRRAPDAIYIDTSRLSIDDMLSRLAREVSARTGWTPAAH